MWTQPNLPVLRGGTTGMAIITLLGLLWPLMVLVIALFPLRAMYINLNICSMVCVSCTSLYRKDVAVRLCHVEGYYFHLKMLYMCILCYRTWLSTVSDGFPWLVTTTGTVRCLMSPQLQHSLFYEIASKLTFSPSFPS